MTYTYDAWGKVTSVKNSSGQNVISPDLLANIQPLRYRGYVYDNETGLYYLQSRYYDPVTRRFINADEYISSGQGIIGNNMFTYCNNDAVNNADSFGNRYCEATTVHGESKDNRSVSCAYSSGRERLGIINYDVPVYSQGQRSLCWAYCQVMTESFSSGTVFSQAEADNRAFELAVLQNGERNWNSGNWPTNIGKSLIITDKTSLWRSLREGPLYGYYSDEDNAHLVLITGINRWNNTVNSNNPWGTSGSQTFEEFQQGFLGMPEDWDCSLGAIYTVSWE